MKKLRSIIVLGLIFLVAACSSGPSDSDVSAVLKPELEKSIKAQLELAKMLGQKTTAPKLDDIKFKVLNKADQGNGKWAVEFEVTGPNGSEKNRITMLKGSSGWMIDGAN